MMRLISQKQDLRKWGGHITQIILDVPYSVVMPPSAFYQIQLILLHISKGKTAMALFSIGTKDSITFTLCNKCIFYTLIHLE